MRVVRIVNETGKPMFVVICGGNMVGVFTAWNGRLKQHC